MRDSWKDYFAFNKKQRNGILVLTLLITGMIIYLAISDYLPVKQKNIDFNPFKRAISGATDKKDSNATKEIKESHTTISPSSKIDINSADTAQLMTLPNMSRRCANMIFKYGKRLGGYYSITQLKEVYAMDSVIYKGMEGKVTTDSLSIHKININSADEKKLGKHPYIGYKLAETIVNYRDEHGKFKSVEALRNIVAIDDSIYSRIRPYLTVGKP